VDAITGSQVTASLGDPDDRLAGAQLAGSEAVVHETLEIEGGLINSFRIVEPVARAEPARGARIRYRHYIILPGESF
jgi:hypothetical protein